MTKTSWLEHPKVPVTEPSCTEVSEVTEVEEARVLVDHRALDPDGPDPFGVIGQVLLGRYRVLRVAGRGGQGVVYEAQHERLKRLVAIKFLLIDATEGPTSLKRFEREAEILAKLSHPSIVNVYDIATHTDGETPFMVMEFVRGEALSTRLQARRQTPWREAFSLVAKAASALAATHAHGIIHRDIKPDNLLVCDDGTLKLLDFGIAQLIEELSTTENGRKARRRLTAMNLVPGTAGYMSPEQFVAGSCLDGRSDVYSLGVVLYRILSARRVWPTATRHEIAQLVRNTDPVDIRVHVPTLSESVAAVIRRAIARDPQRRFQSMEEMRRALLTCLDEDTSDTGMTGATILDLDQELRHAVTVMLPLEPKTRYVATARPSLLRRVLPVAGAAIALATTIAIALSVRSHGEGKRAQHTPATVADERFSTASSLLLLAPSADAPLEPPGAARPPAQITRVQIGPGHAARPRIGSGDGRFC